MRSVKDYVALEPILLIGHRLEVEWRPNIGGKTLEIRKNTEHAVRRALLDVVVKLNEVLYEEAKKYPMEPFQWGMTFDFDKCP